MEQTQTHTYIIRRYGGPTANPMIEKPSIYDYVDYRAFMSNSLDINSKYSATVYVRQAGLGENSLYFEHINKNMKTKLLRRSNY